MEYSGTSSLIIALTTAPLPPSSTTGTYDDDELQTNHSIHPSDNVTGDVTTTVDDDVTTVDDYLWIYFSPIILVLGLAGNILTLAVMRRKRMRGTTTSVYMPVMAVFDTLALCFGVCPEWFKATSIVVFRELHPAVCRFEKFGFYVTSDTAIWVLVLFTVDRFVAVCFPLHKNRICIPRRSKIACCVVFVCAVVKNLHVFWTRGAQFHPTSGQLKTNCGRPNPASVVFELRYRPWMALALISIIPFVILLFCNCVIIWKLTRSRRVQMRKMDAAVAVASGAATVTGALVGSAAGSSGAGPSSDRAKTFKQTTMMCLSVSFVFLVCVIPSIVVLIGKPHWTLHPNDAYEVAKAVSNQLAYFNHSINFFLYCLTGQKFRSELVSMFRQVRHSILHPYSTDSTFTLRSSLPLAVASRCTLPAATRNVHCHVIGVKCHDACAV